MRALIVALAVAGSLAAAGCGSDDSYIAPASVDGTNEFVREANRQCEQFGGVRQYSYGEGYDVVVCENGRAYAITFD